MVSETELASWPSYENPPILEASLTIYIVPLRIEQYALLGRVGEKLGVAFPKFQLLSEGKVGSPPSARGVGMLYSSDDEKETVQARPDGFSYSRQAPYEGWEAFLPKVRKAWEAYSAIVPGSVRAFAVKFVNAIPITIGIPLPELFNTYPKIPDQSQLFDAITMSYKLGLPKIPDGKLSVLMTNLPDAHMLLDNTITVSVRDENTMWDMMPLIRQVKNEIFDSQLQPELKRQFK